MVAWLNFIIACLPAWIFILTCLAPVNAGPIRVPAGEPSTLWQTFHEVKDPLPNITFDIGRSFAGSIPLQRGRDLSLFYWAVESRPGSLTSCSDDDVPWHIWLNGGPGSSSFLGFFLENGPVRIQADYSVHENKYGWNKLADTFWVDQPVGVGYATFEADGSGQVVDETDVSRDFFQFLSNLVKVYPNLAKRPLHLMGESWAGMYIPYMAKYYFGLTSPPVNLAKIVIGDGAIGSASVYGEIPTIYVLETFPQIIGYDIEVFEWFKEQNHLCGYDLNFTYPQNGKFPTIDLVLGKKGSIPTESRRSLKRNFMEQLEERHQSKQRRGLLRRHEDREEARLAWKRNLVGRANGTIDPWYGCDINQATLDYAANFTYPWNSGGNLDYHNVPSALNPPAFNDASVFLNDNRTRKAIHAPNKVWQANTDLNWTGDGYDYSPVPMVFLDDLAANASAHDVKIVIYSGNNDLLIPHRGSEVVIQNTTFGGIQGFARKPSTAWYDDDGRFAGIVHQERGWTYVLFSGAGHLVPAQKPAAAFTFLREFVLGNNQTGLVIGSGESVSVVGGEDSVLAADVLKEGPEIYLGSLVTTSTYVYPSATIARFDSYLATLTATPTPYA